MPVRLTQILFSGLGGHASVAFSLLGGDSARRFDHSMIFYGVEELAVGMGERCDRAGVPYRTVLKKAGPDVAAVQRVLAALEAFSPDVIVLHSVSLAAPVAAWCRVRSARCIAVDHTPNQIKTRGDWARSLVAHWAADRMVFLTPDHAAEAKEHFGSLLREGRTDVIGNGIDVTRFAEARRQRSQARRAHLLIGMHARFTKAKDHETLVRAIHVLRSEMGIDARLRLAGSGATLDPVQKLATSLDLDGAVDFIGQVSEDEIPEFLADLDIFAQATLGETMSTSVMQAMASGLPIVASAVPGVTSMLDHDVTALLVPARAPNAMASALRRLHQDPALSSMLARNASASARASYAQEHMTEQYSVVVENVLARRLVRGRAPRRAYEPPVVDSMPSGGAQVLSSGNRLPIMDAPSSGPDNASDDLPVRRSTTTPSATRVLG